jgi:hypothetical protein
MPGQGAFPPGGRLSSAFFLSSGRRWQIYRRIINFNPTINSKPLFFHLQELHLRASNDPGHALTVRKLMNP